MGLLTGVANSLSRSWASLLASWKKTDRMLRRCRKRQFVLITFCETVGHALGQDSSSDVGLEHLGRGPFALGNPVDDLLCWEEAKEVSVMPLRECKKDKDEPVARR